MNDDRKTTVTGLHFLFWNITAERLWRKRLMEGEKPHE